MQKRGLGQTGIFVSPIGLGTVKFGRNTDVKYPHAFQIPDERALSALLDVAQSLGINVLDTAPAYGESEARLGRLLKGKREQWVISGKAGECYENNISTYCFRKESIVASVEASLQRLRTDYLDILLIHSDGRDAEIIEQDAVFETARLLKAAGKIRAYGLSSKTVAGGLLTVEHADLAMVSYNAAYVAEASVLDAAFAKQKGIFIKKALGSGFLEAEKNLAFILQNPAVTSVIVGTINPEHLKANVDYVEQYL